MGRGPHSNFVNDSLTPAIFDGGGCIRIYNPGSGMIVSRRRFALHPSQEIAGKAAWRQITARGIQAGDIPSRCGPIWRAQMTLPPSVMIPASPCHTAYWPRLAELAHRSWCLKNATSKTRSAYFKAKYDGSVRTTIKEYGLFPAPDHRPDGDLRLTMSVSAVTEPMRNFLRTYRTSTGRIAHYKVYTSSNAI